ncbi:4-hydroxy-3-methylbut-2-enyl diphosphate reductase [Breznakia sp. PF5-3]|uniref:4-hydroxy-3-methylbut-2-enyl diphosphate reductase n=1 Tax=unclassified Breznakia TaxID=2623764 RepID=UPI002404F8FD|nr:MULTISPECIES: 4-hydroxy-3-methylbut-2-enyl diphosphate reductase [unclassified Breznakia]MDL2276877.1 4-hydroxy-3-methylbut-2-enyl diphosphate reductase [Breznakia sp. OttesenSCG-928-G09]MDF9825341.1 4-hydroxy-3-methylbut-2-enyl diphosphate reductase [Breznakia sp. PM6-1]MDF9836196.1 4-hydroxy-3-methylbut-2-enyl diphosphate reductase [Breznakia sp. PF5-3]MDF9838406.1 4-hydroxy-3-methylbut-2-enyl diphosphate reductase [Breznakia sp. PFB2-8]MDF9860422.1 4-hydroxy-3-methylbut-2-enyl diphosphat
MKILKVKPRGYCKGVIRAINIAKETVKQYPNQPIYILGMLVHNTYVIEALKTYGIITLNDKNKSRSELIEMIDHGVVIFTAHGIHPKIKKRALEKGLTVVDATCPDVLKTQSLVDSYIKQGYHILYIGKMNHPEASAICDDNEHVTLIQNEADIKDMEIYDKLLVTNQTTMSMYDINNLFQAIKAKFPNAVFAEEICSATRVRQEAIANLHDVDTLIIVGDKASNNSTRLAQIGKEKKIKNVYLIDDVNDLLTIDLQNSKSIAISSGASTPTYLTNQVISWLEDDKHSLQSIEIEKIL